MAIDNVKSEFVGDMDRLKSGIDEAKGLNSKVYTEESYKKLENTVKTAEEVYSGEKALQAEELRSLCETLNAELNEVKSSVRDSGCKLMNYEFAGNWIPAEEITFKGDIVNYGSESENVLLIMASYENGKLTDSNMKEITIEGLNSADNITSTVNLGNDIENCKIRVFLWRNNSLEPLMCLEKSKN